MALWHSLRLEVISSVNISAVRSQDTTEQRSSSAPVVWIKLDRLHFDVQKVLRQARKMPEKSVHFYRELNRLKKAALCIGFHGLLEGIAMTFERECQILPDGSHPDCALQLTHAAGELRRPEALELEFEIRPMRTKFS